MTQGKEPSDRGENPAETERRPAIDIPPETPNSEDTLGDTQQIDTDAINKRLSTASTPEIPATQNNRPTRPVNRFITTLLKNQTKESQPPRPGSCNYLMFDLSIFVGTERSDILPKLLRELDTILTSKRFHIKVDSKKGYLIILGMAERGATNTLLSIATSMSAWISGTKIILGKGEVEYEDKTTFKIKGLPEGEIEEQVEALGVGIHLSTELNDRINKPGSREGALSRIKTRPSTNQKFVQLTEYEPRVSLDTGGPDIMIGYENEEERLDTILKDNTTRLMVVEAEAGHGKTTLLHHTVGKLPAAILCSCDPASDDNDKTKRESKVTGSSLATIAEQLAATLKRENLVGRVPPDRNTEALVDKLLEFSERTRPEKIQSAQKDPDNLSACCLAAIRFITSEMGEKTPLLIEDLHHADRFSVQYITDIIYSHAEKGGKAVYSKRPEEMYESQAEKQLKLRLQGQYG
ncbi:ATP-binding protein, partial [Candidatus Peregrinibacteria bacterium]|nr:ATP-binding protein [Candidatus Peregrinibacteria bacterium]